MANTDILATDEELAEFLVADKPLAEQVEALAQYTLQIVQALNAISLTVEQLMAERGESDGQPGSE